MNIMYRWIENWDGGIGSEHFETIEEAKANMIEHVKGIRWTKKEMEAQIKKRENVVLIEKLILDDDGDEIDFEDTGVSIEVNEKTVDRVY